MKKELAIQIKPVGSECNINCAYCYANPFKTKNLKIMSNEIIEKIVKEFLNNAEEITVSWHGGEPTLAGLSFFENYMKLIKKFKKPNQIVVNRIQTNATLIDDSFAKFFKENNFIVSVSIDGPEFLHDINRTDYAKKGTFKRAMEGVRILRANGINPEVIATISQTNINYPKEIFNFFYENELWELKLNAIYDSDTDKFSISNSSWLKFMKEIFKLWVEKADNRFHIREIDAILKSLTGIKINYCNSAASCLRWISFEPDGEMYPCEYLRATKSYGNIMDQEIKDVLNNNNYISFMSLFSDLPTKCKKCELLNFCGNGCPATRVRGGHTVFDGEYIYCDYNKKMFEFAKKYIN